VSESFSGRIVLEGLRCVGRHGLLQEETERAQPFEVSLEIEADLRQAAESDDLATTVDYGEVVSKVALVVSEESFGLLEALAYRIARVVLENEAASAVTVKVTKLRPPVAADLSSASVHLRLSAH
jgi:dihydroneopterin aldolase